MNTNPNRLIVDLGGTYIKYQLNNSEKKSVNYPSQCFKDWIGSISQKAISELYIANGGNICNGQIVERNKPPGQQNRYRFDELLFQSIDALQKTLKIPKIVLLNDIDAAYYGACIRNDSPFGLVVSVGTYPFIFAYPRKKKSYSCKGPAEQSFFTTLLSTYINDIDWIFVFGGGAKDFVKQYSQLLQGRKLDVSDEFACIDGIRAKYFPKNKNTSQI